MANPMSVPSYPRAERTRFAIIARLPQGTGQIILVYEDDRGHSDTEAGMDIGEIWVSATDAKVVKVDMHPGRLS